MIALAAGPLMWKVGAAAALVAVLAGAHVYRVEQADSAGYDRAVSDRAARDGVAILTRVQDNAVVSIKQDAINAVLTKAKNEELAPVVRRIYVDRVRVGPGVCQPAAAAKAEDAAGSDSGDSTTRLVSPGTEEDLRALIVKVEKHFATGRTCQEWGIKHGFVP